MNLYRATSYEVFSFVAVDRDSIVMMEQIRSIDKKRICSTALFKLDDEDMLIVDEALNVQLGLNVKSNYKLVG